MHRTGQLQAVAGKVAFMLGAIVAILRKYGWLDVLMMAKVATDTGNDEYVAEKEQKKWLPSIPQLLHDF